MQQNQAHLQQNLKLFRDPIRLAVGEGFGTVASLQEERLPALRARQTLQERIDLPGDDDRRETRKLSDHALERVGVAIGRLLLRGLCLPARRVPGNCLG